MRSIDLKDERILQTLSSDGRISNSELAKRVALSPSACLRRVQELERSGVIRGYRAILDAGRLGLGFTAYVAVGIADHSKSSQNAFEEAIARSEAVRECHNVTGNFEYLLRVECSDLAAYKVFHGDVLGQIPQVTLINSYVVMESPKDLRA
ncbi:MAG: Lrp/AsnC family transcriptional regulator [Pseudomonadota bacterium]